MKSSQFLLIAFATFILLTSLTIFTTFPVNASQTTQTSSVNRAITTSNIYFNGQEITKLTQKEIKVTLTPHPYDSFKLPGYYVIEYLPYDATFVSTDADWKEYTKGKLSLLKFNPSKNNYTLTYIIRIPVQQQKLDFYGIYKDAHKFEGIISGVTTYVNPEFIPSSNIKLSPKNISSIPTQTPVYPYKITSVEPPSNPISTHSPNTFLSSFIKNIIKFSILVFLIVDLLYIPFIKHSNSKFSILREYEIQVLSPTKIKLNNTPIPTHFSIAIHNSSILPKTIKILYPNFVKTEHTYISIPHNKTHHINFTISTKHTHFGKITLKSNSPPETRQNLKTHQRILQIFFARIVPNIYIT